MLHDLIRERQHAGGPGGAPDLEAGGRRRGREEKGGGQREGGGERGREKRGGGRLEGEREGLWLTHGASELNP